MPGVLIVLSESVSGREEEFATWYADVHLPEILRLDPFLSARRYRLNGVIPATTGLGHLTIYEVTDTVAAAQALGTTELTSSASLNMETVVRGFFDAAP